MNAPQLPQVRLVLETHLAGATHHDGLPRANQAIEGLPHVENPIASPSDRAIQGVAAWPSPERGWPWPDDRGDAGFTQLNDEPVVDAPDREIGKQPIGATDEHAIEHKEEAALEDPISLQSPSPACFIGAATPRQMRALGELLLRPVWREELDGIAGASNGPDVVMKLRKRGLPKGSCLVCEMRERVDRDGRTVECGIYSLTVEGRRRVLDWMQREGLSIDDLLHAQGR